jgi:glycosyltransferase involved in cell wall biosynthesis
MSSTCIYGTVYNNFNTVEESIRSVWRPEYDIVIVDNYSTDGTWEKLLELRKEYNLKLYRYRCSRGLGRHIALYKCPEKSITAYFDLDTKYNYAFHKIIEAAKMYGSASAPGLVVVEREYALKRGGWKDLNVGEDTDFATRMYTKIHVPVIIGENANPELTSFWREKRYARGLLGFIRRFLKIHLDASVAYNINTSNILKIGSKRLIMLSPVIIPYAKLMGARSYYDRLPNFSVENLERLSRIIAPRKLGISEDFFFFIIDYCACKVIKECSVLNNIIKSIVSPPIIKIMGLSKTFWVIYTKNPNVIFKLCSLRSFDHRKMQIVI